MNDGLYNKAVNLPAEVVAPLAHNYPALRYSRHAQQACLNDRYGVIRPPMSLNVRAEQIVEVEVVGGRPVKSVVRVPYNEINDIVLVIQADSFVRTVWINRKNDNHASLNKNNLR